MLYDVTFRSPTNTEILKNGKYLVIDPCYVFDDDWGVICDALSDMDNRNENSLVMEYNNYKVYMFNTAYGDGEYPVFVNNTTIGHCGVDAGLLSFIPIRLIDEMGGKSGLGTMVELQSDSRISGDGDWGRGGDVSVGNVYVCTCGCQSENKEEEYEDYAEEEEE